MERGFLIILIIVVIANLPEFKIEALIRTTLPSCPKCPPCICCAETKTTKTKSNQSSKPIVRRIKTNRTDYVNYVDLSKCYCKKCKCPSANKCKHARPKEGDKAIEHHGKLVQSKADARDKKHIDAKHQKDKRYGLKNVITDAADLIDRNLLSGTNSTTQKTVDAADSLPASTQGNGTGSLGPVVFPGEPSATETTTARVFLFNTSTTHPPDVIDARTGHKTVQTILDDNKRSKDKKKSHVQKKELKNSDVKKKDNKSTVDHV